MSGKKASVPKSEQVTELLLDYICENRLKAGDRLPTEEELAQLFDVSRVSIRAATNGLKFFGILTSTRRWGTVIADLDFANLFKHAGFKFAFHSLPFEQLLQMRCVLECGLLEDIALRMSDGDYEDLCARADQCRRLHDEETDIRRQIYADFDFHRALLALSGNQIVMAMMQLIEAIFSYSDRKIIDREETATTRNEHRAIIDALRDHKIDQARSIMRLHLLRQVGEPSAIVRP